MLTIGRGKIGQYPYRLAYGQMIVSQGYSSEQPLFRQSSPNLLSEAEKNGVRLMDSLKVKSIAELRAIPADSLQLLNNKLNFRFWPVVDGWYLPQDVGVIFSKGE